MLKYFYDNDLVKYSDKEITNWKDAIQESCELLKNRNIINQNYVEEVISCVEEHGPYIVIVPQVAMPHSSEKSEGVFGTAISFTKLKKSVKFDGEDQKEAILFFTLAAKNPEEHMTNIQNLSELLMTEGLIEDLVDTKSIEDYKLVMTKYNL
ncbi:PTS sugar transporter subunit IIA [Vagococcus lutrae]|uniref:PTS sugar transporter subunit IIA n=1 Tax=Vagococcus lutrae TaxID=81947 RepID=UPI00200E304E|nr:PTS sugar transporter subunit IIA [Vagococcus lutrae]MDY3705773.1 PTS sugar transporter subunit IIA [Vagococcus lutrae]UQF38303.1 PTS sugar transporter subunit IIA [Vagococcus lutrae]